MTKKWRLSRAAIYGAITGVALTAIGLLGASPDPQHDDPVAHWYFVVGQLTGLTIFFALLFLSIAAARNLVGRKLSN